VRPGWVEAGAGLLLALSLGLKLAALDVEVVEDRPTALGDLKAALAGQGYAVSVPRPEIPVISAKRGGCELTARVLDPHALYHDVELMKLPPGWSVAYGWRGEWRAANPRFWPLAEYHAVRQLARFGTKTSHGPVIMVLNQPGCALPDSAAADIRLGLRRAGQDRLVQ
jgi:hypothetical protein